MEPLQCKITNSGGRIKRLSKRFKTAPFYFLFCQLLVSGKKSQKFFENIEV